MGMGEVIYIEWDGRKMLGLRLIFWVFGSL